LQPSDSRPDAVDVRMDVIGVAELRVRSRQPTKQLIQELLYVAVDWWVEVHHDELPWDPGAPEPLLPARLVWIVLKA
jgi:hypothetical protein